MNLDKWLIIIVIVAIIFVGPTQLPKLAKMFGKSAKAMKDGLEGKEVEDDESEPAPKPKTKAKAKSDDEDSSDEV